MLGRFENVVFRKLSALRGSMSSGNCLAAGAWRDSVGGIKDAMGSSPRALSFSLYSSALPDAVKKPLAKGRKGSYRSAFLTSRAERGGPTSPEISREGMA